MGTDKIVASYFKEFDTSKSTSWCKQTHPWNCK